MSLATTAMLARLCVKIPQKSSSSRRALRSGHLSPSDFLGFQSIQIP